MAKQWLPHFARTTALSLAVALAPALARPLPAAPWNLQNQPSPAAEPQVSPASGTQQSPSQGTECQAQARASIHVIKEPSLGEVARKLKAQEAKHPSAPAPVYTNDNLPRGDAGLSIVGPPSGGESEGEGLSSAGPGFARHDAGLSRARMAELKEQLETHQRELEVLKQKLGESEVQYYPNPSEALRQQYSRSDIDKLTAAIEEKKNQVEADQQAIANLEEQVTREGGDVKALREVPPLSPAEAGKPDLKGVKAGSKEYWKIRFKAAREELAAAQKQQQLSEQELSLLKSQQAHEIGTPGEASITAQVSAKEAEVESARAVTAEAEKKLAALEQEFQSSGAPAEWTQPDDSGANSPPP